MEPEVTLSLEALSSGNSCFCGALPVIAVASRRATRRRHFSSHFMQLCTLRDTRRGGTMQPCYEGSRPSRQRQHE
jgi:hypothetical protein